MRKILAFVLVCILSPAFASVAPLSSRAADALPRKNLRLLSGPVGGQWHAMGELLATAMTPLLPVSSRIGGGVANIQDINGKKAEIAFTLSCFLGAGQSGEAEYQNLKTDNVTLLAALYQQVLYVLVHRDFAEKHGIRSVGGLMDKKLPIRFASLKPGTASEFLISMLLRYGYGTGYDQLRQQGWEISFGNYAELTDAFTSGDLDCFAYTAGTTVPLLHAMENAADLLILPVERDALDVLGKKFKTGTYTVNPGDYKSVKSAVTTLGDYTVLITQKSLPEDFVYKLAETLWNTRAMVSDTIRDFGALAPEKAMPEGLDVHPGAARYWNELLQGKNR